MSKGRPAVWLFSVNDPVTSMLEKRLFLIFAAYLYGATLHIGHAAYLSKTWGYYGFRFVLPSPETYAAMLVLIGIAAVLLPVDYRRPSSVILTVLFIVVYVPVIVFTLALRVDALPHYGIRLAAFMLAFAMPCIAGRQVRAEALLTGEPPGRRLSLAFLVAWSIGCAILFVQFGSMMAFVGLDEIYKQRAAGATTDPFLAYMQTYFAVVLSPALMAIGMTNRNWVFVVLGIAGCMIIFAITAQRTILLLPATMIALGYVLNAKQTWLKASGFAVFLFACLTAISTLIASTAPISIVPVYFQFRTLGLPGLTFSQYADIFERVGYTYWSHIKGISLLVNPPIALANHPKWPALGYIVGEIFYNNVKNNHNANLYSADGVAAAGAPGLLVIGAFFAIWLFLLDYVSRGWDRRFVALICLPMAIALTNGQFSTMLLSFGGIFWILILYFCNPTFNQSRKKTVTAYPKKSGA